DSSNRRERLPKNWSALRRLVLQRDSGRCQWRDHPDGPRCGAPANQVDHIQAGDNHALTNLQALCSLHHARKSAREGVLAKRARRAKYSYVEEHPSIVLARKLRSKSEEAIGNQGGDSPPPGTS